MNGMRLLSRFGLVCLLRAAAVRPAPAHDRHESIGRAGAGPRDWEELWRTWGLEPGVLIPLALAGVLYAAGVARLWRAAGAGRGVRRWEAELAAARTEVNDTSEVTAP